MKYDDWLQLRQKSLNPREPELERLVKAAADAVLAALIEADSLEIKSVASRLARANSAMNEALAYTKSL